MKKGRYRLKVKQISYLCPLSLLASLSKVLLLPVGFKRKKYPRENGYAGHVYLIQQLKTTPLPHVQPFIAPPPPPLPSALCSLAPVALIAPDTPTASSPRTRPSFAVFPFALAVLRSPPLLLLRLAPAPSSFPSRLPVNRPRTGLLGFERAPLIKASSAAAGCMRREGAGSANASGLGCFVRVLVLGGGSLRIPRCGACSLTGLLSPPASVVLLECLAPTPAPGSCRSWTLSLSPSRRRLPSLSPI